MNLELIKQTINGKILCCDSIDFLNETEDNTVDLIVTSPPFDMISKKSYGNLQDEEYLKWLVGFGQEFFRILKPSGSLILDLGGGWTKGFPTKNLYEYRVLLKFCDDIGFSLAQDFFWWDPSKLPTPAQWVNIERSRVKDAVNKIWWLSKTQNPKADNRKVLQKYSAAMKLALSKGTNVGKRDTGHQVSEHFHLDNGGSIPPNLIAMSNHVSVKDYYINFCKENNLPVHPARFAKVIPEFFIRMLTDEGDLVLDPFAGSCVTGYVAESLKRKWICCDKEKDYLLGAVGRFHEDEIDPKKSKNIHKYEISSPSFELYNNKEEEILVKQKQFSLDV